MTETKPRVKLVGEDGNAFAVIGRCRTAAKKANWNHDAIETVTREMTNGDYVHLLATAMKYFEVR